jgi:DMSO/TMAO reductase YedYZ molybdopterin-dependent catalytic subunit
MGVASFAARQRGQVPGWVDGMDHEDFTGADLRNEGVYDSVRFSQWRSGRARTDGMSRRGLLRAFGGAGLALTGAGQLAGGGTRARVIPRAGTGPAASSSPILKPLPPDWFYVYESSSIGANAEMRWEVMKDKGYLVPAENFYIRDHTSTPVIDAHTWQLKVFGTGLRGAPTVDNAVTFSYEDLLRMPSATVISFIECAGNAREFFQLQQGEAVTSVPWMLGGIGVAKWRGVRLADILDRAGLTPDAVDVMPQGLDPDYVTGGVNYGHVRRPVPVAKALDDVILAYEMNGQPLPPDNGFPLRFICPSWIGVANVKWVGRIEVSATPLFSYWNTLAYRLFGPTYPADGTLITRQVVKSSFELEWNAQLASGRPYLLTGRSWSGNGRIARTEVSTDGGQSWQLARPRGRGLPHAWQLWEIPWQPPGPGSYTLRSRATDVTGVTQPTTVPFNTREYLFDAVVDHPVTVT